MQIRFKKVRANAPAPRQGSKGAAGFDLTVCAVEKISVRQFRYYSGIAVEIPDGYVGLVFPRSSIYRMDNRMSNAVGVIDSDYRGEITGVFDVGYCPTRSYNLGDRFAQLVIVKIPTVEYVEAHTLTATERGANGYGSTGR